MNCKSKKYHKNATATTILAAMLQNMRKLTHENRIRT